MSNALDQRDAPPSPLRKIDLLADHFEQAWRSGSCPRIPSYLDEAPVELRSQLLVELVCIDLEQRLRNNLPATLSDYFREFPDLEHLPPRERADLESHAEQHCKQLRPTETHVPEATEHLPDIPPSIGRYRIAGRLGSGGQADVFLSFHPELRIPVVVKWHHAVKELDAARLQHLVREGRGLATLEAHPNLLRVYDLGFHEGRPFLVLEQVQGHPLDQHAWGESLTPRKAAELVAALAEAVHAAHGQKVVHQDINPRNVLIDGRDQPRLIDFGLAWFRLRWAEPAAETRPDGGTPRYLSPEQADPQIGPVGPRTDVFGLGAVLYYLLTGQPLYKGASLTEILRHAANGAYDATALEKARVPRRLAAVCRKALGRDPQFRYATAAELASALRAAVRQPRWRQVACLTGLFLAAMACGWLLSRPGSQKPVSLVEDHRPALEVRVWRPQTSFIPLLRALPLRTGDELQVRFRVPAELHVALCSVNGHGRLSLLRHYQPQSAETELIHPGPGQTLSLEAPVGTELLFICGRIKGPLSEAELRAAWDNDAPWPALDPPGRLIRLEPGQVKEEGDRPRDLGQIRNRPELDPVARRLDVLRERLRPMCAFFEGLAFVHQ